MLSFDDAALYLDDVLSELPEELLRYLNGGVSLVPECKLSDKTKGMYVLGQYFKNRQMGRYIFIYYGSFLRVYRHAGAEVWHRRLKEVLIHELTHHNQSLAGVHDLELKDKIQQEIYSNTGVYMPTKDIKLFNEDN